MHRVGKRDDFPEGRPTVVEVGGRTVIICRVADEVFALEDRCSHDDGELGSGELEGCELICPRHGARFNIRDGTVTAPPAIYPIDTYDVQVRHGEVFVELT